MLLYAFQPCLVAATFTSQELPAHYLVQYRYR